jgi:hypothetical protein
MVTVALVSLLFGVFFSYVLRREVKLPHGECVRAWKLVSFPWSRPEHAKQMSDVNTPAESGRTPDAEKSEDGRGPKTPV